MNIVFMGTPQFSVPILEMLHQTNTVTLVVTQPDMPVGRKQVLTPSEVKKYALTHDLPVFQPNKIKEDYDAVLQAQPDIIVTAAYGQIIPSVLLNAPKYGALNVHASLLPKLRGGAPIQRAIERRHQTTGITIIAMNEKMDAGDILMQKSIPIAKHDTATTLFETLATLAVPTLAETIKMILNKTIIPIKQTHEEATFAPNLKRSEEHLDFNDSARDIEAKIRAFSDQPSTYGILNGVRVKILSAQVLEREDTTFSPGAIIEFNASGLTVQCQEGCLVITHLQPAGKRPMSVKDFINGSGRKLLEIGAHFE